MFFHFLFGLRVVIDLNNFIIDAFQAPEEEWGVAFLFDEFVCLFYFLQQLLQQIPNFLKVLIVECAVDLNGDIFDQIPLFIFFCAYNSFLIIASIVIHEILNGVSCTY